MSLNQKRRNVWISSMESFHRLRRLHLCFLTSTEGHFVAFGVGAVRRGELAGVAPSILWSFGVHQTHGSISKRNLVDVQLHLVPPGRWSDAASWPAVVGEDLGGLIAGGEAPLEGGLVQVSGGTAGEGQIFAFISFDFWQRAEIEQNFSCMGKNVDLNRTYFLKIVWGNSNVLLFLRLRWTGFNILGLQQNQVKSSPN